MEGVEEGASLGLKAVTVGTWDVPKVNVFTAVKVGDEVGEREAVGEAV